MVQPYSLVTAPAGCPRPMVNQELTSVTLEGDSPRPAVSDALTGRFIAVSESRELDTLAGLLHRRGAQVMRCPLVTIVDAPDPAPILKWIDWFVKTPPDYLILMTGEGLKRLLALIARESRSKASFCAALKSTTIIARGPKPAKVLRKLGLRPDLSPEQATTAGLLQLLGSHDLQGKRVSIQLYGEEPNEPLRGALVAGGAEVSTVAPYRYVADVDQSALLELVEGLANGTVDTIIFTSQSQIARLFRVAEINEQRERLLAGLRRSCVAAIGPVVEAALNKRGLAADVAPDKRYFMKPLVQALVTYDRSSGQPTR